MGFRHVPNLFRATLYENGRVIGSVEYDSRRGGLNLGKFGKTADIIRPLLEQLLAQVTRSDTPQTGTDSNRESL